MCPNIREDIPLHKKYVTVFIVVIVPRPCDPILDVRSTPRVTYIPGECPPITLSLSLFFSDKWPTCRREIFRSEDYTRG